jgi:hypothetical protein
MILAVVWYRGRYGGDGKKYNMTENDMDYAIIGMIRPG